MIGKLLGHHFRVFFLDEYWIDALAAEVVDDLCGDECESFVSQESLIMHEIFELNHVDIVSESFELCRVQRVLLAALKFAQFSIVLRVENYKYNGHGLYGCPHALIDCLLYF